MFDFDLPATTTEQEPPFATAAACRAWLEQQPLGSPVQMQAALLRGLNHLNRYRLPATERLAIMELLRQPVHDTQDDNIRRFAGKPLPLTPPEQAAFDTCLAIWNGLATGYLHCLAACAADEPGMATHWPLAAQRALAALAALQFDTCRGGRLPSPVTWRRLHRAYAAAEKAGKATLEVEDTLRLGRNPATPEATWVEGLLLQLASPYELPPRQMAWVARWAQRFSGKVRVFASPPTLSTRSIPLCVDLDGEGPARYQPVFVSGARFVDTSVLRESLKKRLIGLQQGQAPKDLQLGEDCTQPLCEELLTATYYRWCKGGAWRQNERRAASGSCALIGGGLEAIYYYLAGRKPFQQPAHGLSDTDIRRQREQIATFGRVMEPQRNDNYSQQQGYHVEQWEVMEEWTMLDQSATGMRITRPVAMAGERFGGGQLVAAQPSDAQTLLLGSVRWALIDASEKLQIGVRSIAGKPQPISVRGTGLDAAREKYQPGFLLPPVDALKEPASIVIPPGAFRRERILEVLTDRSSQVRLTGLIERGTDFERATYEPVGKA
jgi:hypothetical protein